MISISQYQQQQRLQQQDKQLNKHKNQQQLSNNILVQNQIQYLSTKQQLKKQDYQNHLSFLENQNHINNFSTQIHNNYQLLIKKYKLIFLVFVSITILVFCIILLYIYNKSIQFQSYRKQKQSQYKKLEQKLSKTTQQQQTKILALQLQNQKNIQQLKIYQNIIKNQQAKLKQIQLNNKKNKVPILFNYFQNLFWPEKLYSQQKYQPPTTNSQRCPQQQFPVCIKFRWDVQQINKDDIQNMQWGNITQKSLKTARKFYKLGLAQPTEQLLLQQKNNYLQKYPDFFNYKQELPFCVIMLSYKNVKHNRYLFALKTILRQKYKNYHIVYIDDESHDGTGYLAQKYINQNAQNPKKHKVVINNYRKTYLQNNYIYAHQYCHQYDIQLFAPDGDDGLVGVLTLQLYNYYYQKYDIWVSWGATIFYNGQLWAAGDIPQTQIKNGNLKCCLYNYVHHPKAFYNKLWTLTSVQRLLFEDGTFYASAGDNILMRSMAQMGRYHLKEIPQPVYLYYNAHQLNQGKTITLKLNLKRINHMGDTYPVLEAVDCLFPLDNGTCLKASSYILAYQRGQIKINKTSEKNKNSQITNFNKYPKEINISENQEHINNQQNLQNLKKFNISDQSFSLAKEYLNLGLIQPSQQLISRQKQYYNKKYNLSSETPIEFPFCIFIAGYNNIENQRYKLSLNSIFRQEYKNYKIVYVDDHSSQGNVSQVQQYIKKKSQNFQKHAFIKGKIKRNITFNHYIYAKQYCNKYDLEFQIDGNDGLIGTQVFKLYNYFFQKYNIWAAWGAYLNTYSKKIQSLNPMVNQQISSLRFEAHPLVFYEKLWMMTKPRQLLNKLDWFYWTCTNLASMRRICQLSGIQKILYINELVYLKVDNHQYSQENKSTSQQRDQTLHRIMEHKYKNLYCLIGSPIEQEPLDSQIIKQVKRIKRSENCLETRGQILKYWKQKNNLLL